MRMLALVLFVGLAGSVALALKETRPRNASVDANANANANVHAHAAGDEPPPDDQLSTAGRLPFGMVPGVEDRDSEGDIPDEIDRCPNEPEDGRDDYDGCPEPDTTKTQHENRGEIDGKLIYW